LITNKSLFVASSWSRLYLLIKDARSFEHKVSLTSYCAMRSLSEIEMGSNYNEITRIIKIRSEQISRIMNFVDRIVLGKVTPMKIETRRPG